MTRVSVLRPLFVEFVPATLEKGTLYVSMIHATAAHRCCCGCGLEVTTPLGPYHWTLQFDGESVSLTPSIGNWSFPCQSHYWIRNNRIEWAPAWSQERIAAVRAADKRQRRDAAAGTHTPSGGNHAPPSTRSIWTRLKRWWAV